MKRWLWLSAACVAAVAFTASATAGTAVTKGYTCTVGLPTADGQGVLLTTTKSVTVIGDNGVAVTHCTFTDTGYTPPGTPFPFNCNINGIPADVTELHITGNTVSETCVARPNG